MTYVLTLVEGFIFDDRDAIRLKLGVEEATTPGTWLATVGTDWLNTSNDEGIGYDMVEITVAARLNDKRKDKVSDREYLMTAV